MEQKNILIQPIVINYTSINGMPLNRWLKPIIAWYGDMDLKPHLINVLKLFSIKNFFFENESYWIVAIIAQTK